MSGYDVGGERLKLLIATEAAEAHARRRLHSDRPTPASPGRQPAAAAEAHEHLTDLGNARRLVRLHGRDLRYDPSRAAWFVWDGRRWKADADGEVMRRAKATVSSMYEEASQSIDSDQRRALAAWAMKSEADPRLAAIVRLAETEPGMPIRSDAMDTKPDLLNVLNGTIDLRTFELREARREDLLTRVAPVAFDPNATAPSWDRFLERVLPDPEVRAFVGRAAGYTLTGETTEQVLFLLHGDGANGKSILLGALDCAMGPEYSAVAAFESFIAQRHDGGPRNDLARLAGVRFVQAQEVDDGRRLAEAVVKAVTGGDRVTARFLYKESFEFTPNFKLWLSANYKPEVRGVDHAIWRRIMLVPFGIRIPEA